MSASVVFTRHLGRFIPHFAFKTVRPRRLCVRGRLRPAAAIPHAQQRCFSVETGKTADKVYEGEKSGDPQQEFLPGDEEAATEEEEAEYEHSIKQRILNASLDHVLEHGWTKKALEAAAESEGLSTMTHGMFERGGAEIVSHFYSKCNSDLAANLRLEVEKIKAEGHEKPKSRPFIEDAIETRLRMIIPYHSIWKEAMAIQTLPQNAPESWKNLMEVADDIWYYAGDRSVEMDWYTKRLSLAAVYKSTEIFMLQDSSPDFQDTWAFLDSRLNDLQKLGSFKRSLDPLKEGIMGLCNMGRNIVGMNSRNR